MVRGLAVLAVSLCLVSPLVAADPAEWRSLFNGKDLSDWETYLGKPQPGTKGLSLPTNEKGEFLEAVGVNKDPLGVYSVVTEDGEPAIRITGQIIGALTSLEDFENYHLKLEVKWGEKKWPPRLEAVRDSGLLYHCIGPHGAAGAFWMKSFECQIQENDNGDYFPLGAVFVDVEGNRDSGPLVFHQGGTSFPGWKGRVVRNPRSENPTGEWNTVELYAVGQTAVHVCNGKTNMILTGLRHQAGDKIEPLTKGKLQIQSEAAEVFYRNIAIRPISKIPDEVLLR